MNHHYRDIRDRIAEPPTWWDEHAVPRYCAFAPDETADIYAQQVALVEIACQACAQRFLVCFSWGSHTQLTVEDVKQLHYGDPPNACDEDCAAGATMNSVPLRVVEFWRRGGDEFTGPDEQNPALRVCLPGYFDWRRIAELEVEIDHEWALTDSSTAPRAASPAPDPGVAGPPAPAADGVPYQANRAS